MESEQLGRELAAKDDIIANLVYRKKGNYVTAKLGIHGFIETEEKCKELKEIIDSEFRKSSGYFKTSYLYGLDDMCIIEIKQISQDN